LSMSVRVLFFAQVSDATGIREESYVLPDGASVAELLRLITSKYEKIEKTRVMMKIAVNRLMAEQSHVLRDGDVVALFPPISGG